jgi:CIC family chloride channel protein
VQSKIPHAVVLFLIFVITLGCGILSYSLISTGHALTESLLEGNVLLYMLFILLFVRTLLTLGANTAGVTGGIFLPLIAVGALFSTICAEGLVALGVPQSLYTTMIVFGITACLAGMMNMPVTAVAFSIEALGAGQNVIYTALSAVMAFILVEAFRVRSINDKVLDGHVKARSEGKRKVVVDTCMTVQEKSFAEGKRVKDVFWPADCIVLSVTHAPTRPQNAHGLSVGDVLHLRYTSTDEVETKKRLQDILGEQESK